MRKKKILIVDDDENARAVITQMLGREGYILHQASSGKEALEKVAAEDYDLLILDYMMPEMDGLEVLVKVKKLKPRVKVIMITAVHLTIEKAVEAMRHGASDYVAKPFEMKVFRETVKRVLADAAAETLELSRLKEASPVVEFEEHFQWMPQSSLILVSGVTGVKKRLFVQQLAYARMLKGEAVVYLTNDHSPEEVEREMSQLFPVEKFIDAGLLTLRSPPIFWESNFSMSYQFNLAEFTRKAFYDLERSLKIVREAVLIIDSFSTQCNILRSNERVQLLHLLRSLTRRRPVMVLGIVHKDQIPGEILNSAKYLADAVLDLDIDPLRKVVRYFVEKFPTQNRTPQIGELEVRGGLLVSASPIAQASGYTKCVKCGEEFFIAFGKELGETEFICSRCSKEASYKGL